MSHTAFRRGAASSSEASMRSLPVGSTPSLSASRRLSSSAPQGASSFWLSSTSKRSRSFSTTSSKVARVTRIFCFTLSPKKKRAAAPPLPRSRRLTAAVQVVRQPKRHPRPQVHDDHAHDDDQHVRHHAPEDLVEGHVLGGDSLQVERRHGHRRRQERRLEVDEYERAPEDRVDVEVLQQRQEDRDEDHDDLGPLERPAENEDDRLRQDHELYRRHVEREHPRLDQLLPAEDREHAREQRRANEQPAHHGGGLRRQEHRLLDPLPRQRL